MVSKKKPKICNKCGSTKFIQEKDTFDTWFSSAQWPVVTLKTISSKIQPPLRSSLKNAALKTDLDFFQKYYPTSLMETGYDILPFWVMRMLMMGIYLTGKVPFKKVYLHGLVRDERGQKMSKSKGNVVNPLEVVKKYGADALRMSLVMSTTAGRDSATGEGKIKGMRNLTNKIWNAARYVMEFLPSKPLKPGFKAKASRTNPASTKKLDLEFQQKLKTVVKNVTKQLEDMKPGLAAEIVYNQFWHWFCDECIENAKKGKIGKKSLVGGLRVFLKLFHPFVPFVTEAVWQELPKTKEKLLITANWPLH